MYIVIIDYSLCIGKAKVFQTPLLHIRDKFVSFSMTMLNNRYTGPSTIWHRRFQIPFKSDWARLWRYVRQLVVMLYQRAF